MVGALALIWSLSTLHAYAFAQREGLGRHLVRVAAGFGLAALGLELLLPASSPAIVAPRPFGLWFAGQLRWRSTRCTPCGGRWCAAGAPRAG